MRMVLVALFFGACNFSTSVDSSGIDASVSGPLPVVDGGDSDAGDLPDGGDGDPDGGSLPDANPTITLVLQDGSNGYTGTRDTFVTAADSDTSFGGSDVVEFDDDDEGIYIGFIKFLSLFGNGPNQIPPGAEIKEATLQLVVIDPSEAPAGTVRIAASAWGESSTFNSLSSDVAGLVVGPLEGAAPVAGIYQLDVLTSLTAWSTGVRPNEGWVFLPAEDNDNGVDIGSSEQALAINRPQLTVTYVVP